MKLFHAPGSCSEGILFLLKIIGEPFEIVTIDLKTRAQFSPEYRAVNPKGKVPALQRPDGSLLTEFPAIAWWLAKTHPALKLIGTDVEAEVRTLEALDYLVASVHMRGFTLVKATPKFVSSPEAIDQLRTFGMSEVTMHLGRISDMLGDKPYLLGEFSIADAAAFYLLRWATADGLAVSDSLLAYFERLNAKLA